MPVTQSSALSALLPFQVATLGRSTPAEVCQHIVRATEDPDVFIFGELLDEPNVNSLKGEADADLVRHHRLVELFAWGTWRIWNDDPTQYPPLSPKQIHKLKLLSLVTAARSRAELEYPNLMTSLGFDTSAELEALLRSSIATGLIVGKIDASNGRLNVSAASPVRDAAPADVGLARTVLSRWAGQIDAAIDAVEQEMDRVNRQAQRRADQLEKLPRENKATEGLPVLFGPHGPAPWLPEDVRVKLVEWHLGGRVGPMPAYPTNTEDLRRRYEAERGDGEAAMKELSVNRVGPRVLHETDQFPRKANFP